MKIIKAKQINLERINDEAKRKKEIKEKKKAKNQLSFNRNNEKKEKIKKIKKIKQSFIDDGEFIYTDTLILRMVSKSGIPLEECVRKSDNEITHNSSKRIGNRVIYKDGILAIITDVIKTEKDLVYIVQEADAELKQQYINKFGENSIKVKNIFNNEIIYRKPNIKDDD